MFLENTDSSESFFFNPAAEFLLDFFLPPRIDLGLGLAERPPADSSCESLRFTRFMS